MAITIKNEEQIELMRRAGQILARVHAELAGELREGMTTKDIDRLAEEMILSFGGYPNFLNYHGFPASACVSVNDEVVHGIPSDKRILKNGDIVSIDTGVLYKGYHSDAARTHAIGEVSEEAKKLISVTEDSFFEAIRKAKPGNHIVDIGQVIQRYALSNGYSVVRALTGHGIGTDLHEAPNVPNYKTLFKGPRLRRGMTLAIEPMVNIGSYDVTLMDNDWTYATSDGTLSSHYENTVVITDDGCEILTLLPEELELRFSEERDNAEPKGDIREAIRVIPEEFRTPELGEEAPEKAGEEAPERAEEKPQEEAREEETAVASVEQELPGEDPETEGKEPGIPEAGLKAMEQEAKAPYQTLTPEEKRARREELFDDD